MLSTITLLTAFAFAATYPLCFLISADDPLKNNFHKFHLGLPNVVGGIVLVFIWLSNIPLHLKIYVTIWKASLISVSSYSWKKPYPKVHLILIPCVLGIFAFLHVQNYYLHGNWETAVISILSSLIFCSSLFAMNLGHEYLNVHGLSVKHLMRSINIFWILLAIRFIWDAVFLVKNSIIYAGDIIPLYLFLTKMDGFLLSIGLFFGTLFPIIAVYFAKEVLKLKNTQSATGILYVILCSVIIGDIAYKYYLVKFGISL